MGSGRRWFFGRFAIWVLAGDAICYVGFGRRWFFGRFAIWVLAGDAICYMGFGRRWFFERIAMWVLAGDGSLDDLLYEFWPEICVKVGSWCVICNEELCIDVRVVGREKGL
ncbi:hypothetical protein LINPERPRIM_LOCUS43527 [Linum perenne]